MISWNEIDYNIEESKIDFNKLNLENINDIKVEKKFEELRNNLKSARDKIIEEEYLNMKNIKLGYKFDLLFGLELYEILNNKFNFKIRDASNDDIWRYMQIRIVPDIVFERWGFNIGRFYSIKRRIWLKTIWWYIHLSWNHDKKQTYDILKNNTTDTIMQLVERPGIGYNLALYREIMKRYADLNDGGTYSRDLFRKIMIINTARTVTISPELIEGGIPKYVDRLIENILNLGDS